MLFRRGIVIGSVWDGCRDASFGGLGRCCGGLKLHAGFIAAQMPILLPHLLFGIRKSLDCCRAPLGLFLHPYFV